jgi:hypothetical protein
MNLITPGKKIYFEYLMRSRSHWNSNEKKKIFITPLLQPPSVDCDNGNPLTLDNCRIGLPVRAETEFVTRQSCCGGGSGSI